MLSHQTIQYAALAQGVTIMGLAIVVVLASERTRSNSLVAAFIFTVGLDFTTAPTYLNRVGPGLDLGARLQGLTEVGALVLTGTFMLSLLASSDVPPTRARTVRVAAWSIIALAGWHGLACMAWPAARFNDYLASVTDPGALTRGGFWLFAGFYLVVAVPILLGWGTLSLGGVDPAELRRAQAFACASVFVISATATPALVSAFLVTAWISVGFYGHLQYVSAHAQRGALMGRFLSPKVAELVAAGSVEDALKPHLADVTVVSADLRGFTAYSEGVPSQAVVDLLAEYYDAVGAVAARHGATITSYAGDGVMILVGAPIPEPQHASTGIRLAQELLAAVDPVLERWQTRVHALGLGVGVASGRATVGAITSATRMEYTAIGPAVNLAARLCSMAAPGEVLFDLEARRHAGTEAGTARGALEIKGFSEPQQVYAVGSARFSDQI